MPYNYQNIVQHFRPKVKDLHLENFYASDIYLLNVSQTTTKRSFLNFIALCSGETQSQFARDSTHTCYDVMLTYIQI